MEESPASVSVFAFVSCEWPVVKREESDSTLLLLLNHECSKEVKSEKVDFKGEDLGPECKEGGIQREHFVNLLK